MFVSGGQFKNLNIPVAAHAHLQTSSKETRLGFPKEDILSLIYAIKNASEEDGLNDLALKVVSLNRLQEPVILWTESMQYLGYLATMSGRVLSSTIRLKMEPIGRGCTFNSTNPYLLNLGLALCILYPLKKSPQIYLPGVQIWIANWSFGRFQEAIGQGTISNKTVGNLNFEYLA